MRTRSAGPSGPAIISNRLLLNASRTAFKGVSDVTTPTVTQLSAHF